MFPERAAFGPPFCYASRRMSFALRITLGSLFLVLGVIGSVLPVMQGWIFFLMAGLVLFPQSRFAEKVISKAEPKMPRLVARLRRWGIGHKHPHDKKV